MRPQQDKTPYGSEEAIGKELAADHSASFAGEHRRGLAHYLQTGKGATFAIELPTRSRAEGGAPG